MTGRIRHCPADHIYTLSLTCPACGKPTSVAHPARFSPEDKYGRYRRLAKHD
ncbi:RNA-protein complex protein Nop10 [Methanoregula sp.]|uniref:RNA-protein complex protein Nop10 n=1 Tax=Methanoregula sp. TaxID=2052170 RepID=UPI000CB7D2D3|nr:RNA-protein complex protein Nop10 [Methanoregula sp.]PKG32422.1 MAG: ribosome biogenesis protein [Methanoregula sp.]